MMALKLVAEVKGMTKVALITGINGQDGSYLAEELLGTCYEVHGLVAKTATLLFLSEILDSIQLHRIDLTCQSTIEDLLTTIRPHEVYNLAAQSSVGKVGRTR